jgi:type IV pilus assembly protein PilA
MKKIPNKKNITEDFVGEMAEKKGFTLIEILLVVALIAILAGIVILAINPNKQLGDTRNAQRKADVNTILNAVYQYSVDNNGSLPGEIGHLIREAPCPLDLDPYPNDMDQLCKTDGCSVGVLMYDDLVGMTQKYLVSMPFDPFSATSNLTGYYITRSDSNRVTVCAPSAEQGALISVTR